jgi:8-oxo-dGTP diphosphatase
MTRRIVVGAAITAGGRVMAARRRLPAHLAGRWEFPGGKVEAGESEPDAVVRECREELGVQVEVGPLIGRSEISDALGLALYLVGLVAGDPRVGADHDELRWLGAADLDDLAWLDADLPLVPLVRRRLVAGTAAL